MRTIFKILLAPVWLLLAILKLAFKLVVGAAAFVLAIGGGGCYSFTTCFC